MERDEFEVMREVKILIDSVNPATGQRISNWLNQYSYERLAQQQQGLRQQEFAGQARPPQPN